MHVDCNIQSIFNYIFNHFLANAILIKFSACLNPHGQYHQMACPIFVTIGSAKGLLSYGHM